MSKKEPKQYGPKTKKEKRMEIICATVAMVLMVGLIIVLIVASSVETELTIGQKPWAWITASVLGGLILITLIVYITLKVQFMKQRRVEEINTLESKK